jgi:hypothetical protein
MRAKRSFLCRSSAAFRSTSQAPSVKPSRRVEAQNSRERSIALLYGLNRRSWTELRMTHINVFPANSFWGVYLSQRSASWKASSSSFSLSAFSKQSPLSDLAHGRWSGGAG